MILKVANSHRKNRGSLKRKPQRKSLSIDGLRLLVVDDNNDSLSLVVFLLEEYQVQLKTAKTVDEAIAVIQEWKPDVLVSDISMPGKDGYFLINWIRNQEAQQGRFLPAVALTGYVYPEYRNKALDAGFEEVIIKPFHPDTLITTIAKLAQQSDKQRLLTQEQRQFAQHSRLLKSEYCQFLEQARQTKKQAHLAREQAQQVRRQAQLAMEQARQVIEKAQLASKQAQQIWRKVQSTY